MLEELQLTRTPIAEIMPPDQFHLARSHKWAEYQKILDFGKTINVSDDFSRDQAIEVGKLLQAASKEFTEFYKPVKKAFDDAKKPVLDAEKSDAAALDTVKSDLAAQVLKYQRAQEKIRQEQERAERERLAKEEEERRLLEAIELEALGLKEEAAQRLEEQAMAPAVIIAAGPKKVSGFVEREVWKATVENLSLLIKAVAAGKVPLLALTADQAWLNKQATDYGETLQFPGVSVKKEVTSHFRS